MPGEDSLDLTVEAPCLKPKKYGRHLGNVVLSTSIKHSLTNLKRSCCYKCDFVLIQPLCGSWVFQLTQQGREFAKGSGNSNAGVSRAAGQGPGKGGWALASADTYRKGAKKPQVDSG